MTPKEEAVIRAGKFHSERVVLMRRLRAFCIRHDMTKFVVRLEDRRMVMTFTWTPAIEKRIKSSRPKAGKKKR